MTKTVQYQNELHKFLIWDTAGQERVSNPIHDMFPTLLTGCKEKKKMFLVLSFQPERTLTVHFFTTSDRGQHLPAAFAPTYPKTIEIVLAAVFSDIDSNSFVVGFFFIIIYGPFKYKGIMKESQSRLYFTSAQETTFSFDLDSDSITSFLYLLFPFSSCTFPC